MAYSTNSCNCTGAEDCKCGDSCTCENCHKQEKKEGKACACAGSAKGMARI
ncbi:hypothetical protein MFLAVUS_003871 [Mucor flavus]|uniref:Metallothionein n=1 Tax=Mucor flavus TaxID=439312 RepID=A0ABP9YUC4_9FUNG